MHEIRLNPDLLLAAGWAPYAKAGAYLVLTVALARLIDWLLSRRFAVKLPLVSAAAPGAASRLRLIRRLVVAAVLFVGVALALVQIPQVDSLAKGMIASAGITAAIVGLASRSVIANFVSGLIIAFSQPVRIGDHVMIDDISGTIEDLRLTYTFVRTADNRRVLIPNEQLTSKIIHNYSLVDPLSSASFEFEVPAEASLPKVFEAALDELGAQSPVAAGRPPALEIAAVTVWAIRLRISVWGETRGEAVARSGAVQRAVVERLQREGVFGSREATGS